jgi:putative ABC transport system permease protein
MTINDLIDSSLHSLSRTKARSVLTMLGIVIGVMSVIMMLSMGEAAQRYILAQVSSFGSDVIFIQNGPSVDEGQPSLFVKESLTYQDIKKLQQQPWVVAIAGKIQQSDRLTANGLDTDTQIMGSTPDEEVLSDLHLTVGSFFSNASVESRSREIVLGHDIAEAAFGAEDPLGKTIKINQVGFKIIGVLIKSGSKGFTNIDKQVYMPVTAAMDLYNKKYLTYATLRTTISLNDAKERIAIILRERHNIDNPEGDLKKDDFHAQTQEDLVKSADTITGILQILLTSIAAISLIVGGIGIMNIMYVAVTERTKEIGLRKSIGARQSDILRQFVIEAVIQTSLGGMIGTVLGIGLSWLGIQIISNFQPGWTFVLSTNGVILGLSVSAAIGIIFGYFPARKAARLSPIDALRKE